MVIEFSNPFRPGAGQMPPYLAGRETQIAEFQRLLEQDIVLENLLITGLRGVGKTVLAETLKPIAIESGWIWLGNDLSEATSVSEERLAVRLLTDLSYVTSALFSNTTTVRGAGFTAEETEITKTLDFNVLNRLWADTPGLSSDKLKIVLETVWGIIKPLDKRGIIFAYDEAQNLADHAETNEFPLSLLLDVFQSLQRREFPLMLVMSGLPTLFPKLVEARAFAERMFCTITLGQLDSSASRDAIKKPIEAEQCPVYLTDESVEGIYLLTHGYPYFVQYICRVAFDVWVMEAASGKEMSPVPAEYIISKLDADFFSGRWGRLTDRQRDLLTVAAQLDTASDEFTIPEIVTKSHECLANPFERSQASQMLTRLSEADMVYRNRRGKYSLAVPLLDQFIRRQLTD